MFFYTLFYLLFSFLLIYPPVEFVTAGLTIPGIFSKWLGSEGESFVAYHMIRIVVTLFIHSNVPLGYAVGLYFNDPEQFSSLFFSESLCFWWDLYIAIASVISIGTGLKIMGWLEDSWNKHPIPANIRKFCNPDSRWKSLAESINAEFKRFDKVSIQTNSLARTYVTDNWIIKVGMYNVFFAHQNDAMLIANDSDTHQFTPTGAGETQYINIEVKSLRNNMPKFSFRIIAQDFKELQEKVRQPIIILPNIVFQKSLTDKFIEVFKEQILLNEKFIATQELESCIGCMHIISNIKLTKQCIDAPTVERDAQLIPSACTQCNCRPMWCADCMARWFASRQDPDETELWLSSKCTCPVCRATFCLLDVALIQGCNI